MKMRNHWLLKALVAVVFLVAVSLPLYADTPVSGTISTNTTWTAANSPYIVTGDVYVQGVSSPVLTVEVGVTVKFNAGLRLEIGAGGPGGLQAIGTSGQPIVFTANTATPTPGYWWGIVFRQSTLSTSRIAFGTVSYGGYPNNWGGIHVNYCSPTIENTTVQNSAYAGITVVGTGASPVISSSTLTGNPVGIYTLSSATMSLQTVTISGSAGFAISQDAIQTLAAVSALTLAGNGTDAIELRGGTVSINTTWRNAGWPYVVTANNVAVQGAGSPVLTIEVGVTVKLNAGLRLEIGAGGPGGLQAIGTSGQPIVFTANTAAPTPGYWRGVIFGADSGLIRSLVPGSFDHRFRVGSIADSGPFDH